MARKKATNSTNKTTPNEAQPYHLANDADWGGFINIRLDDEQAASFKSWYSNGSVNVEAAIDEMLGLGCKLSAAYDAENQCYICSITGGLVGANRSHRYTSTSRASTLHEAYGLSVWKHYILCEGDYGNYSPKTQLFMKWG